MTVFDIDGNPIIKDRFRVCGLNVGNFSLGASGDPTGTDEMYNHFLETFRECNANVYMFSEWDVNWKTGVTSLSVFGFLKPNKATYIQTGSGEYAGQMNYMDFEIESEYHQSYTEDSNYYFLDNVADVHGRKVHFICTHLTWKTQAKRQAQIREILNYIDTNNIEYYVIAGDMNLGLHSQDSQPQDQETKFLVARQDVNLLESNGATSVQGGPWGCRDRDGFINTAGHTGWDAPNINMFDNIVVSPNIFISNVFTVITEASDHDALCADLIIL